jgi:RNA polymerase sigma-70 factor (ECF subfamily)
VARFQTTRWSLILKAAADDSAEAALALALLCEAYWYPVYAFVRRQGYSPPDAEDLTQGYFARFLEKDVVRAVRPGAGRFRSFLVVSVRNFLHNERDRERALKRGGGRRLVSLDVAAAEREYEHEPADAATPESLFEQSWARTVFDHVVERLEQEKSEIAEQIKEVFAEAKGNGFDVKILRKVIRIRKQDAAKRQEEDAILDLYLSALGVI